ncbi:MAG: phage major capsid protein [Xanthomonadales bacterium]|nr:phage major capsid protein [Xanthomonadales bacterium]
MRAICTVLNTSGGNNLDFPKTDDTAVAAAQHTEATAMTDDGGVDATFAKMTLGAFAYDTEWVQISMEIMQDSAIDIEQFIGELLGERLARRVNTELTIGDGTGDPLGIVAASSLGKTAASQTAFTADEIIDLLHSVDPAYRASPKARWQFNDTTLASIRKLKDGNDQYIWSMGDIRVGEPCACLAFRIDQPGTRVNAATGTKPIVFGDLGKYYVRRVGAPVIGVRREYYWPNIGLADRSS